MKFLLVGINASYSHTCLSVRSIAAFCKIPFLEFTINQPIGQVLKGIQQETPDVVMFSTYIWNAEFCEKIITDLKSILPECLICAGGPEFSYAAKKYLTKLYNLDFIIEGEGEKTVSDIIFKLQTKDLNLLKEIKGLYIKNEKKEIIYTGKRELICNLETINFPYPELINSLSNKSECLELKNKILYYESSRGCPYSCSYCLSSVEKHVRFMPLDRVFADLQIFLDSKIPLVKFVDRTFNLDEERYIKIWDYIIKNHNKITMFHFEIEAEYLSKKALDFLQNVPKGIMQFEIGVQSSNKKTLKEINRSDNTEKLFENIKKIPRTIHQHLDLIAGLPYEDLESFGNSFNFVMDLKPDAFQLGFLKILYGTQMEQYAIKNGWKWSSTPVYETFSTPYLSYNEMLFLKDVEVLLDAYWNSHLFNKTINYIFTKITPWQFFYTLTLIAQKKDVFIMARRETFWFEFLFKNINSFFDDFNKIYNSKLNINIELLKDLIRYDFIVRGKLGGFPDWYEHRYNKEHHRILLEQNGGIKNARLDFAHSELETFNFDVEKENPEDYFGIFEKLIRY